MNKPKPKKVVEIERVHIEAGQQIALMGIFSSAIESTYEATKHPALLGGKFAKFSDNEKMIEIIAATKSLLHDLEIHLSDCERAALNVKVAAVESVRAAASKSAGEFVSSPTAIVNMAKSGIQDGKPGENN